MYTYIHMYFFTFIHIYKFSFLHIYMYTFIHIYIFTFLHIHVYIHIDIFTHLHLHSHLHIRMQIDFHIQIDIYKCIDICIYVFTYSHSYVPIWPKNLSKSVCSTSGGSFPPGHVLFTLGLLHLHQRAESSFGGLRWSALLFQNVVVFEAMVVLKMV